MSGFFSSGFPGGSSGGEEIIAENLQRMEIVYQAVKTADNYAITDVFLPALAQPMRDWEEGQHFKIAVGAADSSGATPSTFSVDDFLPIPIHFNSLGTPCKQEDIVGGREVTLRISKLSGNFVAILENATSTSKTTDIKEANVLPALRTQAFDLQEKVNDATTRFVSTAIVFDATYNEVAKQYTITVTDWKFPQVYDGFSVKFTAPVINLGGDTLKIIDGATETVLTLQNQEGFPVQQGDITPDKVTTVSLLTGNIARQSVRVTGRRAAETSGVWHSSDSPINSGDLVFTLGATPNIINYSRFSAYAKIFGKTLEVIAGSIDISTFVALPASGTQTVFIYLQTATQPFSLSVSTTPALPTATQCMVGKATVNNLGVVTAGGIALLFTQPFLCTSTREESSSFTILGGRIGTEFSQTTLEIRLGVGIIKGVGVNMANSEATNGIIIPASTAPAQIYERHQFGSTTIQSGVAITQPQKVYNDAVAGTLVPIPSGMFGIARLYALEYDALTGAVGSAVIVYGNTTFANATAANAAEQVEAFYSVPTPVGSPATLVSVMTLDGRAAQTNWRTAGANRIVPVNVGFGGAVGVAGHTMQTADGGGNIVPDTFSQIHSTSATNVLKTTVVPLAGGTAEIQQDFKNITDQEKGTALFFPRAETTPSWLPINGIQLLDLDNVLEFRAGIVYWFDNATVLNPIPNAVGVFSLAISGCSVANPTDGTLDGYLMVATAVDGSGTYSRKKIVGTALTSNPWVLPVTDTKKVTAAANLTEGWYQVATINGNGEYIISLGSTNGDMLQFCEIKVSGSNGWQVLNSAVIYDRDIAVGAVSDNIKCVGITRATLSHTNAIVWAYITAGAANDMTFSITKVHYSKTYNNYDVWDVIAPTTPSAEPAFQYKTVNPMLVGVDYTELGTDIPDASPTVRGLVNTVAQTFAGDKTLQGTLNLTAGKQLLFANTTEKKIGLWNGSSEGDYFGLGIDSGTLEVRVSADSNMVKNISTSGAYVSVYGKTETPTTNDNRYATTAYVQDASESSKLYTDSAISAIPDATVSVRGHINTLAQTIAGRKTFDNGIDNGSNVLPGVLIPTANDHAANKEYADLMSMTFIATITPTVSGIGSPTIRFSKYGRMVCVVGSGQGINANSTITITDTRFFPSAELPRGDIYWGHDEGDAGRIFQIVTRTATQVTWRSNFGTANIGVREAIATYFTDN